MAESNVAVWLCSDVIATALRMLSINQRRLADKTWTVISE